LCVNVAYIDIINSIFYGENDPLTLSLKRKFKNYNIYVNDNTVYICGNGAYHLYEIPKIAKNFMKDYYSKSPVGPFKFSMKKFNSQPKQNR